MNNSDIAQYINSKDMREYLKDYPFTFLEAAWIIDRCREVSLEQKLAAWAELIETT